MFSLALFENGIKASASEAQLPHSSYTFPSFPSHTNPRWWRYLYARCPVFVWYRPQLLRTAGGATNIHDLDRPPTDHRVHRRDPQSRSCNTYLASITWSSSSMLACRYHSLVNQRLTVSLRGRYTVERESRISLSYSGKRWLP